ncbi:MAG: ABC transporter substrate-binding protein [Rickettsiales bacterium]|nr:ABC transporter substrate-binding protein [Rickettsiales bacterium]
MMKSLIVGLTTVMLSVAAIAGTQQVEQFADKLASDAIAIVSKDGNSTTDKQTQLEALFEKSVDIDWVARFVLGKHWRNINEDQRDAYVANYKKFLLKNYTMRLTEYTGQTYKIVKSREDGNGEYILTMELINTGEPNVLMDYKIRESAGGYKIFDIIVEGVSMITTQRSEFSAVISNKGIDFLISALKKKAA